MENVKQSYTEQPNPPTDEMIDTIVDETAETESAETAWACIATEVGYGDAYSTAVSVQDKLNDIDATVAGKANATHNQSASTITGLATVAITGKYADLDGKPTIPTSLPANGGNADTVDNKHASDFATASHTHTQYAGTSHTHAQGDITGLTDALDGKANTNHTHNYAAATHTHSLDSVTETATKKIMTAAERTKLSGIAENANNYTHPSSHAASMITGLATVATSGKYADLSGKPTSMTPTAHTHAQSDVTGLVDALAGKAAASHTHGAVTASANGMMIAADKTKLDGIAAGANKTVVDSALSSTSTNPVQNKVIDNALYGKANASHTHAQNDITGLTSALSGKANTSHTHAQSNVTGLIDALAGKAATNHNHDSKYISKSLQITADDGDVSVSWSGQNVVTKFQNLSCGMCTAYAPKGNTGNPNSDESFRFICHKTGTNLYGWIMAYGAKGSVYSGYIDNGTWRGWKCIYESTNSPLWSGAYYMNATQTVTPSKALSKCRNGWVLVWSDYDPATSKPTGADHFTTVLPKLNGGAAAWSGQSVTLAIPTALSDSGVLTMAGKKIYVHDTKIVGHAVNKISPANDVVLRAVYEY